MNLKQAFNLFFLLLATTLVNAQSPDVFEQMRAINPQLPPPLPIDTARVRGSSIRLTSGKHLTLYTDIRDRQDVDEFLPVFDAAVPLWCEYFDIDTQRTRDWHLRGIVMGDRKRFENCGLLPNHLPNFPAGYQNGHELWVYLQPGKYYTRHLLLHEGTHAFMQWFLGGNGAPWYSEGVAELLGLHRWNKPSLEIGYRLHDRSEAEYWGRIKLIKEDCQQKKGMLLDDVFNIPNNAFRDVRFYAWSWAACEFFANHPQSKQAFRQLKDVANLAPSQFNQHFINAISNCRNELERDWKLFIGEIEFGYDIASGAIGTATDKGNNLFQISASRSWQETDLKIKIGDKIRIAGKGRFIVAEENSTPWPCESNGISIEYYRGKPLGILVAGIVGDDGDIRGLFDEQPIGLNMNFTAQYAGTLCLRINESPAHLTDNQGALEVAVKRIAE